jgi:hypothetical protein
MLSAAKISIFYFHRERERFGKFQKKQSRSPVVSRDFDKPARRFWQL